MMYQASRTSGAGPNGWNVRSVCEDPDLGGQTASNYFVLTSKAQIITVIAIAVR